MFHNKGTWDFTYQHKWVELNISQLGIMSIFELLNLSRTQRNFNEVNRIISLLWSIWESHNVVVLKNESYSSIGMVIRAKKGD